jgi:hypothetical protein
MLCIGAGETQSRANLHRGVGLRLSSCLHLFGNWQGRRRGVQGAISTREKPSCCPRLHLIIMSLVFGFPNTQGVKVSDYLTAQGIYFGLDIKQ